MRIEWTLQWKQTIIVILMESVNDTSPITLFGQEPENRKRSKPNKRTINTRVQWRRTNKADRFRLISPRVTDGRAVVGGHLSSGANRFWAVIPFSVIAHSHGLIVFLIKKDERRRKGTSTGPSDTERNQLTNW